MEIKNYLQLFYSHGDWVWVSEENKDGLKRFHLQHLDSVEKLLTQMKM